MPMCGTHLGDGLAAVQGSVPSRLRRPGALLEAVRGLLARSVALIAMRPELLGETQEKAQHGALQLRAV